LDECYTLTEYFYIVSWAPFEGSTLMQAIYFVKLSMQFHNAKGFFFRREVKPAYNILYLFNIYIEAKLIDFDTSTLACDSTI